MTTRQQEAIAFLWRQIDEWRVQMKDRPGCNQLSDDEVEQRMVGHAMWDDPPQGYTKRRLADWSRGFLSGCALTAGNNAGAVEFALSEIAPNPSQVDHRRDLYKRRGLQFVSEYAFALQSELDEYVEGVQLRHFLRISIAPNVSVVLVQFVSPAQDIDHLIRDAQKDGYGFTRTNDAAFAFQHSEIPLEQPIGIHIKDSDTIAVCHPSDLHFWSNVQAWEDSNDIIALILNQRMIK